MKHAGICTDSFFCVSLIMKILETVEDGTLFFCAFSLEVVAVSQREILEIVIHTFFIAVILYIPEPSIIGRACRLEIGIS